MTFQKSWRLTAAAVLLSLSGCSLTNNTWARHPWPGPVVAVGGTSSTELAHCLPSVQSVHVVRCKGRLPGQSTTRLFRVSWLVFSPRPTSLD